ncbi:hypothetical protein [Bacillus mycoides]|uniref:SMI1/KNR4 family protein n=1 Tax=Bacillus mycoides TaxID=1405 RepID=A0ABC9QUJ2_BACMY|nr:hypothetical protein [Bacillus mycoides]EJR29166.1 hypothetical protein III_05971 [Bacillus mycoides]
MFKNIYVKFPPVGEESLEFQFFLDVEGDRFYECYKEEYKKYLSNYFPEYQETYEKYLENFLLPHLQDFKEIRLGYDSWNDEGIWIGIDHNRSERGVVLPKVNFKFYKGALAYKNWCS